jgi:hypothetical protein
MSESKFSGFNYLWEMVTADNGVDKTPLLMPDEKVYQQAINEKVTFEDIT